MIVGKEAVGKEFIDRENELKKIDALIPRNNIAIYGPRRIGKSSLMLEFAERTVNTYAWARIDVHRIIPLNQKNFIKNLGTTFIDIYASTTGEKLLPFMERIKRSFPELVSRLQINIKDWVELEASPSTDISPFLKKTFQMGESLAERAKKDFLVLIDEIPGIVRMTKGRPNPQDIDFLWALRGYFNEAKHIHYILSGSEVGMMEHLCGSKEAPFYGSFIPIKLEGLERKTSLKFLEKFVSKKYVNIIAEETMCFPLYLQAYAMAARLGAETLNTIRCSAFDLLHLHFRDLQKHLSPQQQIILKTMASKNIPTTRNIAKENNLPYTTVHSNITRMITTGFLKKIKEGEYEFIDPVFKKWLQGET